MHARIFFLGLVGLLGIFYISTFIDLVDKLFRGEATSAMLLRYFYFRTPQFVYYVIPMSALVSTLVTVGVMTKNSELLVMRACGISLYRTAAPLLIFAVVASAALFAMQEQVLPDSNREAEAARTASSADCRPRRSARSTGAGSCLRPATFTAMTRSTRGRTTSITCRSTTSIRARGGSTR